MTVPTVVRTTAPPLASPLALPLPRGPADDALPAAPVRPAPLPGRLRPLTQEERRFGLGLLALWAGAESAIVVALLLADRAAG